MAKSVFPKIDLTRAKHPNEFLGAYVNAHRTNPQGEKERIQIKSVCGSRVFEQYLELNGSHVVHSLSYFMQCMEGKEPSQIDLEGFERGLRDTKVIPVEEKNGKNP